MRAVVQRVHAATAEVEGTIVGRIDAGLLVYLGVGPEDTDHDVALLVDKVRHLRIFNDDENRMNRDVVQIGGQVLAVSAFTVQADARKGRRPSFDTAAEPDLALALYKRFCTFLSDTGIHVELGSFGEHMHVSSINDGPICILLDSRKVF